MGGSDSLHDACESREVAAIDISRSGSSPWWYAMLSKILALNRNASNCPVNPPMPSTSCENYESGNLSIGISAPVSNVGSAARAWPPRERLPFLLDNSDAAGGGQRAESVDRLSQILKRIMDVVVSAIVLFAAWPLMLAIALAIKLESPGRFIYRSPRVGKSGRKFICYKFRTMVAGSDRMKENLRRLNQRHGPFFKIAGDPR